MLDAEAFGDQQVLGLHHVCVVVARERSPQPVGRFGRLPSAQAVGQDDKVLRGIERLTRPEQHAAEPGREHASAGSGRTVQNQHRCARALAQCGVVQPKRGQDFASVEAEVAEGAFGLDRPGSKSLRHCHETNDCRDREAAAETGERCDG